MGLNLRDQSAYSTCLPLDDATTLQPDQNNGRNAITKAVIIAAGNGSRLQGYQGGRPKPLVKVGGIPLLERVIRSAKRIGVTEFVIVVGYQAGLIRKSINCRKLGVKITWVRNLDWRRPNGVSVLKAERFVDDRFYLFMSDHIFDLKILEQIKDYELGEDAGTLCVDYALNRVQNLDDATKVRIENGRMVDLGKSLTDFNAIDVGIFVCRPALFDALRQSQEMGDESLSGGIRVLAQEGRMGTYDIGESFWQDVDTIPDIKYAEKLLLRSTRSKGDGLVARLLNRRISNRISKWLLKTPITPNQISIFNVFFMAFIAWLVSFGKPLNTVVAGILFQLASIIDGCDGEVALIKLRSSKRGALVDTITDHLSYFIFIIGVTVGTFRATGDPVVFFVTGFSLVFLLIALRFGLMYIRRKGSGSLRDLDRDIAALNHARQTRWYLKFFGHVHHLGRRDVFSFGALLIMLWGNISVFYWGLMGAVNLMSSGISISAASMLSRRARLSFVSPFKAAYRQFMRTFVAPKVELGAELQPQKEIAD